MGNRWKIAIWVGVGWLATWLFDPFITVYRLNWENLATSKGYDKIFENLPTGLGSRLMNILAAAFYEVTTFIFSAVEFFSGDFGLGFSIAAILFSFWDPVKRFGRRTRQSKRRAEELAAANRWSLLAKDIQRTIDDAPMPRIDESKASLESHMAASGDLVARLQSRHGQDVYRASREIWDFMRDLAAVTRLSGDSVNLLGWKQNIETLTVKAVEVSQEHFKRHQTFAGKAFEGSLFQ